jgi:hypothetical protein
MLVNLSCALAAGLLFGVLMTSIPKNKSKISNLKKSLNKKQKEIYDGLTKERLRLYIQGLILGIVISVLYLYLFKNKLNTCNLCNCLVITLGVGALYYLIYPKTDYIINYIQDEEQRKLWLDVYRNMQLKYYGGIAIGVIIYILLALFHKK